ncbi:hypothetical protein A9Q76_05440 [Arcobacter sp. 31_11_sub10_T18]|nr:hypothetical protein A9Q76_05440 [Arcobacter sp. 31_11_sub10_T18]
MRISSIIEVVEGELKNSPSISFVYKIKTHINKVHEGDLFIAKNEEDIPIAIKKGAFGIIYDFEIDIIDKEIAWIQVANINYAISKLIRFKLSNQDLKAFYCNKITFELLTLFVKYNDEKIKLISNNLDDEIELMESIENFDTIICQDKEILNNIYPNNKNFNHTQYAVKNLVEHSLFETTFSCGKNYFSRLKLPSLYINHFLEVYAFLNNEVDTNRLKKLRSFKPLFIDKYFKMIEYGNSDKFILSQIDESIAVFEINHLKNKYKYAKTYIFSKKTSQIDKSMVDYFVNTLHDMKELLVNIKFNAIYVVGFSQEEIEHFITKNNTKALL